MQTDHQIFYGKDYAEQALYVRASSTSLLKHTARKRIPQLFLSLDQAINFLNAHLFAESIGQTLNTHATVQLQAAPGFMGARIDQQRGFITDLMKSARSWVKRHTGEDCHWAYCLETDDRKRLHLHLHLPLRRLHHEAFREFLKNQRDLNGPCWGAPIFLRGGEDNPSEFQMAARRRYLLKSLQPDGVAPNGKPAFHPLCVITEAGTVDGCRCRASNSLNRKARAAAGWQEIIDLAELNKLLPIAPGRPWWERFREAEERMDGEARHV